MTYLLDTNACIAALKDAGGSVARRLLATPAADVALCDVVKAELYYGAFRSARRDANLARLRLFFGAFRSLPFDGTGAEVYGRIRAELGARGTPIGPNDLFIAAIAVANGATLVTHNTREFQRVGGLALDDWG